MDSKVLIDFSFQNIWNDMFYGGKEPNTLV